MHNLNEPRVITAAPGDPVPAQTSHKASAAGTAGGVGAAMGGLISAALSGFIIKVTGADLSPETTANLLIVCTAAGAALVGLIGARIAAYRTVNYLK